MMRVENEGIFEDSLQHHHTKLASKKTTVIRLSSTVLAIQSLHIVPLAIGTIHHSSWLDLTKARFSKPTTVSSE